ncbi:MAG TPA: IPT/TIG domain-containing protein [Candidatus Sulfotelmatobacter sp.]|nr:IPT/TIG domain-containing protein [Candidatus Sulfotelmatobacter sp.]
MTNIFCEPSPVVEGMVNDDSGVLVITSVDPQNFPAANPQVVTIYGGGFTNNGDETVMLPDSSISYPVVWISENEIQFNYDGSMFAADWDFVLVQDDGTANLPTITMT